MECDSTNPAPHLSLAVIYQDQDEMDLAERHYEIALDVAPTQAHVQHNIGMFYHTKGKKKLIKNSFSSSWLMTLFCPMQL